jgi:hypothetical protein
MISSNPYHPLCLQWELLTHGWGNHGWLMERRRWWWWRSPPNPHPDRVPEQSFWFRIAVLQWNSIWEKCRTLDSFRSKGICRRKGGSRRWQGRPHHPLARPGLARTTRWCGALLAPLCFILWLRGSSGKIGFLQYFPGFFLQVGFLHKNETPGKFCWKQRLSVLVVFKTHKLEEKQ